MKKEIHIFAGHFGSGKTETAINFAIKKREEGKKTVIIDIDNVNPYFRTNEAGSGGDDESSQEGLLECDPSWRAVKCLAA